MAIDFPAFVRQAVTWANGNFPTATAASKAEHLRREVNELQDNPHDSEELADALLLTLHLTENVAGKWPVVAWFQQTEDGIAQMIEYQAKMIAYGAADGTLTAIDLAIMIALIERHARRINVDLGEIGSAKLLVNQNRTWGEPDADGVVEHVEQGGDALDHARAYMARTSHAYNPTLYGDASCVLCGHSASWDAHARNTPTANDY